MTDWVEVVAGDRVHPCQRAALVFKTIGWILISWAALVSIWIWMGAKAGSNVWLWSTVGLFLGGAICLGIAGALQARSAQLVEVPEAARKDDDRIRAA